jgi:phage terminase small subunit
MNDVATISESGQFGPAMAVLTEKQRCYVIALFEAPKTHGALTFAAKRAGYGTPTSSRQSLSQMAHALNADPKIQAAIAEVSQQFITVLGPHAVRALKKVLDNPSHRDFGRALGIVTDRVAPVQSTAVVKLEGEVRLSTGDTAHILERIEQLARKFMVALPAPKIIEHDEAAA